MTDFLIKLFVSDSENVSDIKVREKHGKLSGVVGIVCNTLLSVSKIVAGFLTGSISIVSDGANNLSDAMSNIVTLVSFKMSGKPADKEHPYGHERIEYVASLVVSFLILFIGWELIKTSVSKLLYSAEPEVSIFAIGVLVASICVKLWMFVFNRRIGRKIDSAVVIAAAQDSLNDVIATVAVLISYVVLSVWKINLDGYVGLFVALYIIYSGICLIKDTVGLLLGVAPSEELIGTIKEKISSYKGVEGTHDLIIHNYGPRRCFASVHIEVDAKQDIIICHDIADTIENDFKNNMGIDLVVHLDPLVTDDEVLNAARVMIAEILSEIDSALSHHDFRMVKCATYTNLVFDIVVPAEFYIPDNELINMIVDSVHNVNKDYECVITIDKNYSSSISSSQNIRRGNRE